MEYIAAGLALFGIFSGKKAADKQSDAARRQAAEDARLERIVTAEKIHQLNIEERALKGETLAAGAGSGITVGRGSILDILTEQAATFAREVRVVGEVGATRAAAALTRGENVATQAKLAFRTGAFQQASNIFTILGQRGG